MSRADDLVAEIALIDAAIRRILTSGKKSASMSDGQMSTSFDNLSLAELRELRAADADEYASLTGSRGFYVS